ncbi:sensor histidine kinase [Aquincola sp. S2]|uniref:histidine kinase n=1 Tax=Pseudaquabacterium terrae TaxID=2732868 RepID=A0ABX2EKK6_9BURK|nr:sensor histidine kinase [Aquabacterium terrae]NRF69133.1 sensor histidine kinase [Aquabacterium terrae]
MRPPSFLTRLVGSALGHRSLHRQLLLWLLLPQLVLWMAAAFVTYNVAERYASRGIDASLLQATRSLARQVKPVSDGLFIDFPRAAQDIIEADPDDRVYYMVSTPPGKFILGNKQLPLPPGAEAPRLGEPVFYDATLDKVRIRLAALFLPIGSKGPDGRVGEKGSNEVLLVQIARSQASRDELAKSILLDTVLPLSALIALMTMIVWAGIRAGLAPLARLRALVEDRAPNDLAPLELEAAPQEVRALARALNALLAAVQESVAGQRRFISNAAHQLRTPLAGLKSQTEIALQSNHDPALAARLERVHEGAVRSAHLVNQLLTLTRAEPEAAGALPRTCVDLRALVVALVAECVPRALAAGIDLGIEDPLPSAESVRVMGAELLLREAVFNLVDNAIRYAGRGAEVTVSVRAESGRALVEVADNGPGLNAEQREAVFGRFVRATHEGTGCGLGLAIVREIAERHRGRITLEPNPPQGLRARFELPLQP